MPSVIKGNWLVVPLTSKSREGVSLIHLLQRELDTPQHFQPLYTLQVIHDKDSSDLSYENLILFSSVTI